MNMAESVLPVSTAQKISLAFGALYALIGILGFSPLVVYAPENPGVQGVTIQGLLFGVFAVNTVHNLSHLVLGGLMIWAGMSRPRWDVLTRTLAVAFVLLLAGSFVAPFAEGLSINLPDTALHLITALVFAYFATKVPDDDFVATP